MKSILQSILQKLHIKGLDELDPSEQVVYKMWEEQYNLPDVTIETISDFITQEIEKLVDEFPTFDSEKDIYLKAKLANFKAIKRLIEAPKVARKQIDDMINKL